MMPSSPQVQSKVSGAAFWLVTVKITVTVLGSLRRSWLIAKVMPGRSPRSAEATTALADEAGAAAAVVADCCWLAAAEFTGGWITMAASTARVRAMSGLRFMAASLDSEAVKDIDELGGVEVHLSGCAVSVEWSGRV